MRANAIDISTPHRRTEPDPVIDWVWEDGQLHGRTADGTISVSANLQRAQWSWGAYTLSAEQLDDQVWLTFDKVVDEVGASRRSPHERSGGLRALDGPSSDTIASVELGTDQGKVVGSAA